MNRLNVEGLIAASYTPLSADGTVHVDGVGALTEHLIQQGVAGLYVCGSTGEGISLTGEERRVVAEASVSAVSGRIPVIVQVGHNSLYEARALAAHAQSIGAAAVSANAPSYFKVTSVPSLVECMQEIAAGAPDLPFYYYHIPHLTGAAISMLDFLPAAVEQIPNLVGIKYTAPTLHEYQSCLTWNGGSHEILWGSDEMLLPALSVGGKGAVGSTYNIAAPLYRRLIDSFATGDIVAAREHQARAIEMIRIIYQWPFHSAMKEVLRMQGVDCGHCRLPLARLRDGDIEQLRTELESIGFFQWAI